jgi:predicted translin family RNA/ssDNA-binding protein
MVVIKAKVIDATHLELSRPIATPSGGTVLVSVAGSGEEDDERQQWLAMSVDNLQSAYGESEPAYTPSMVQEPNPEYAP